MRVVFLGKNKPYAVKALRYLLERGVDVPVAVAPLKPGLTGERVQEVAAQYGVPCVDDTDLYAYLAGDKPRESFPFDLSEVDVVMSFLFWKRIKKPLIGLGRIGCINFHPAPLPDYRGWGAYINAILNNEEHWGVTAHWVDEDFDTGNVIKVRRFDVTAESETSFTLEQRSQLPLYELMQDIMERLLRGETLPNEVQGEGVYYGREETEAKRRITQDDSPEMIDRKVRAFWYPPYGGATVNVNGADMVVVNKPILTSLAERLHRGEE